MLIDFILGDPMDSTLDAIQALYKAKADSLHMVQIATAVKDQDYFKVILPLAITAAISLFVVYLTHLATSYRDAVKEVKDIKRIQEYYRVWTRETLQVVRKYGTVFNNISEAFADLGREPNFIIYATDIEALISDKKADLFKNFIDNKEPYRVINENITEDNPDTHYTNEIDLYNYSTSLTATKLELDEYITMIAKKTADDKYKEYQDSFKALFRMDRNLRKQLTEGITDTITEGRLRGLTHTLFSAYLEISERYLNQVNVLQEEKQAAGLTKAQMSRITANQDGIIELSIIERSELIANAGREKLHYAFVLIFEEMLNTKGLYDEYKGIRTQYTEIFRAKAATYNERADFIEAAFNRLYGAVNKEKSFLDYFW